MAMQLGHLKSILLFSLFINLFLVLQVGGDIVNMYNHVTDHEQPAPQWSRNETSHDQEHEMMSCPPWKYHKYNSSCVCGSDIYNVVECEDDQSMMRLQSCHCMSYSDHDTVVMGACPYRCTNYIYTIIYADTNLSNLCNSHIQQNRQGQMCGQCKDNHSPSPYSYQLKCAHCSRFKYNWLKYLVMAYLPLTVFFLVVISIRFSALSASMNAFIMFSQIISSPSVMTLMSSFAYFSENHHTDRNINLVSSLEFTATMFGIWNLDFFRMLYKPYCLHPNLSVIQVMCLDYAVAMYPLFLIVSTYMLFKLHERFKMVQFFFKPIVWLFMHFNDQWNASTSLFEVFATFILLSYVKVINTSFDILMPTKLYNVSGHVVGLYTYYNGSMKYFGHDHLPYAVLAIFMFIIFNLAPFLLLCLYPCRCFQSCLNCCRLNSQVLRTFMDAFQGCYKFEPYDCRYWAAFFLFLRIAILFTFAITRSGYFVVVSGILIILATMTTAIIKPYRKTFYNIIDVAFLSIFVQVLFSAASFPFGAFNKGVKGFLTVMFAIGLIVPLVYITILAVYKILPKTWITLIMKHTFNNYTSLQNLLSPITSAAKKRCG